MHYTYLECDPRVELQCHEGIPGDDAALKHHDAHALRLTGPRDIEQRPATYNKDTNTYISVLQYTISIHMNIRQGCADIYNTYTNKSNTRMCKVGLGEASIQRIDR
jgi:hypothetical protein